VAVGDHLCPRCGSWLVPERTAGLCGGCLERDDAPDLGRSWPEVNRVWCDLLHRGIQPPHDPRWDLAEAVLDTIIRRCPVTPDVAPPRWVGGWV
jgi:NMD protein affecting ribosome stability and mRNA decay